MYSIILLFYCTYHALTYVDTYFNQPYELKYDIPGYYILYPKDYKYAPTIFVSIYGAGGGTDVLQSPGCCKGQDGAYLSALLDTRFGTTLFNITVGKGGVGGKQNITGCNKNIPIIKMINPVNGGDSSIISTNQKTWAIAKGGAHADTNNQWQRGGTGGDFVFCKRPEEKTGYTNISFGYGILFLERQNGENSYYSKYFWPANNDPGYGGIGSSTFNENFSSCAVNYQLFKGGSGNDGLLKVVPVAVSINILLYSIDIQSVDIDFYVHT